jgi:hypothetical protein
MRSDSANILSALNVGDRSCIYACTHFAFRSVFYSAWAQNNVSVPSSYMAQVNEKLGKLLSSDYDLDGVVTAPVNAQVFAYGQAFFPSKGRFVAGIHDVHCSTHRGADNGWVVVNGQQHPSSCTQ